MLKRASLFFLLVSFLPFLLLINSHVVSTHTLQHRQIDFVRFRSPRIPSPHCVPARPSLFVATSSSVSLLQDLPRPLPRLEAPARLGEAADTFLSADDLGSLGLAEPEHSREGEYRRDRGDGGVAAGPRGADAPQHPEAGVQLPAQR
jgi:hypothetical protein